MPAVLGVDGCNKRWLTALVEPPTGQVEWALLATAEDVLASARGAHAGAVGVDVPIGLPVDGPRGSDLAARALLSPRGSSVFPAPLRAVLEASSYDEACALSRAAHREGKALSLQAFHLLPLIRQWDRLVTPAVQRWVVEVHPELSFLGLTGRVLGTKHKPLGRAERLAALRSWLPQVDRAVASRPVGAPVADALDALAAAWTAQRWAQGRARVLPDDAEFDDRGRWLEIVS